MTDRILDFCKTFWRVRFLRFMAVGGINTLWGFGVYALLVWLGCNYKFAALAGTVLGILFNFMTTGRIVFGNRNNFLLFQFIGVYAVTYFLNIGAIKLLLMCGFKAIAGGAIALFPMALVSFVLNRFLVFKKVEY